MLDHISVRVRDFQRAVEFYRTALAPIGYQVLMEFPDVAGIGEPGKPDLWVQRSDSTTNPIHLAFRADRAQVDAFHAAALIAGGTDNGAPGVRLDYHPHYYGAYVLDPEGNNIEVVCHDPPGTAKVMTKAGPRRSAKKTAARKPAAKKSAAKGSKKASAPQKAKGKPKPKAKATKRRK